MISTSAAATAISALLLAQGAQAQTFSSFDISGVFEGDPLDFGGDGPPAPQPDGSTIARPSSTVKDQLVRLCGCTNETVPAVDDIRAISDTWAKDGNTVSSHGFSNLVWAWGQFIDHDVVATVDGDGDDTFDIRLQNGAQTATMSLHRLVTVPGPGSCPVPHNVISPLIDAGTVYGDETEFTQLTLRAPGTCFLRVSEGDFLPVSTEKLNGEFVFVAGDARVDEHSVLTSMHTLFLREHNRLCRVMMTDNTGTFAGMSADDMFTRARNVVSAKIQQITLREFLPILGISEASVRSATPMTNSPQVSVEFAMAGYRFGHDLVPKRMGSLDAVQLFNGNKFFGIAQTGTPAGNAENKLASVFRSAAFSIANEIDGKLSDTLRNFLFGNVLEDLFSRNIFRARDAQVVQYDKLAACYGIAQVPEMMEETPDPFAALLRENKTPSSKVFGPTLNAMLTEQFHRIFFGNGGDFWENRMASVAGFDTEISESTFSRVIRTNVPGAPVPGAAFDITDRGADSFTFPNPTVDNNGEGQRGDYDDDLASAPAPAAPGRVDPFADDDLFNSLPGGGGRGFNFNSN